jgi:hypothetical protein
MAIPKIALHRSPKGQQVSLDQEISASDSTRQTVTKGLFSPTMEVESHFIPQRFNLTQTSNQEIYSEFTKNNLMSTI